MAKLEHRRRINEIIAEVEQAAYERGWHDALKHVMSTASASSPQVHAAKLAGRQTRAKRGAILEIVYEALKSAQPTGLAPVEIVEIARERGEAIAASSVRSTLSRLQEKGQVERVGRNWYLKLEPTDGGDKLVGGSLDNEVEPESSGEWVSLDDEIPF